MAAHRPELLEGPGVIADEIPGQDHDVRLKRRNPIERRDDVVIVHAVADVDVADLDERAVRQPRRQMTNRQVPADQLEPVRLDLSRVQTGTGRCREGRARRLQKSAP
jgi:hypothetical protein